MKMKMKTMALTTYEWPSHDRLWHTYEPLVLPQHEERYRREIEVEMVLQISRPPSHAHVHVHALYIVLTDVSSLLLVDWWPSAEPVPPHPVRQGKRVAIGMQTAHVHARAHHRRQHHHHRWVLMSRLVVPPILLP